MSSAPAPAMVFWKPFAMARKASSTTTTSAIATMVDSDSHRRCMMLFRLMEVTAITWRSNERMVSSTSSECGCDLEAHGVERGHDAGDQAERQHQSEPLRRNQRRHREARN